MTMPDSNANGNGFFILPSKMEQPPIPSGFVARPELLRKLLEASRQRLTRVVAPQGYGKTSALSDLAQQYASSQEPTGASDAAPSVAWITLDAQDNQPARFWSYMLAALKISDQVQVSGEHVTDELLSRAAAAFYERAQGGQTLLILDNYGYLDNHEVEDGLLRFMAMAPRALHVMIVASRLSRFMDYGSYDLGRVKLDYFDFMLRQDEAEEFLRSMLGEGMQRLTDDDVKHIYEMTEGWAQGLDLAVQVAEECAVRNVPFGFCGTNSAVDRFFSASARPHLSPETYALALELSVLERFSARLCEKVLEGEGVQERFQGLIHSGSIFTISCDVEGEWFRFNNLFADWLRNQAMQVHTDVLSEVCQKASEWFFEREQPNEAAKYLLMASDFGYAQNITFATCGLKRREPTLPHLVWLGRSAAADFPSSPLLCMLAAWAFNASGHVRECLYWLSRFESVAKEAKGDEALAAETVEFAVKCVKAKCAAMVGDVQQARMVCEKLLDDPRASEPALLSMLNQSLGEVEERSGNNLAARERYLQAQASASVDKTTHHLYFNMLLYADLSLYMGNLGEAQDIVESVIVQCPRSQLFYCGAVMRLAGIYLERNQMDDAQSYARRAISHLSLYMNADFYLEAKVLEADCLMACGQLAEAYEAILEGIMQCERTDLPRGVLFKAYFKQAEIALKRGNVRDVQIVKRKYAERLDGVDANRRVLFDMICGFERLATDCPEGAAECFGKAVRAAQGLKAVRLETKALAYELAALQEGKKDSRSDVVLCQMIGVARTHKLVRSVLDGGGLVFEALKKYSSGKHAGASLRNYIKLLLIEFDKEAAALRSIEHDGEFARAGMELLSPREQEVLRLLDIGLSRQEIAESLSVSLNTAKKHLSNIYSKLGVSTREQALSMLSEE